MHNYGNISNQILKILRNTIYEPDQDGKSKTDHLLDMLNNAVYNKNIPFSTVLFDTWYATNKVANDKSQKESHTAQNDYSVRWVIENMHCEIKQLTGIENNIGIEATMTGLR